MGPNFLQALRAHHFRYRHAVFSNQRKKEQRKKCTGPIFEFRHVVSWGAGQSQILSVSRKLLDGFRWKSSCVVTFWYSFSSEYQKRENQNSKKSIFWKFCLSAHIKSKKIGKFSLPILKFFIIVGESTFKTDFSRRFSAISIEQFSRNR